MEHRRSRSIESPRRQRRDYRRYSRSRSRSPRDRNNREVNSRRRSRSRSREPAGYYRHADSSEKDLYRDIIYDDYQEEKGYRMNRGRGGDEDFDDERFWNERGRDKGRDYERDQRDREYDRGDRNRHNRHAGGNSSNNRRFNPSDRDRDSDDSDEVLNSHYYNKTPSNTIIVLGLQSHITEADIMSALIQLSMAPTSIRLIRKRNTGASRGFAFVEFNTIDEAAHWMELTQGTLVLQDQTRASLQYSHSREQPGKMKQNITDWYCGKCGVFNFKRRYMCFKCYASRDESEEGGEGSDEVSNILTKKIMLRNLDALTNEEAVLTAMQQHAPDLAKKINKILVSRDTLTQTSRGICYLNFESLVDSMNLHNTLNTLEPPLKIDNREILVTYCIDHENRQIVPKKLSNNDSSATMSVSAAAALAAAGLEGTGAAGGALGAPLPANGQYTLSDVPRLADYSAAMYASTPAEHAHYLQYYTDYYISEISKGQFSNLPSSTQVTEGSANSGAAVALSAIQRKQKKMSSIETTATQAAAAAAAAAAAVKAAISAAQNVVAPRGNDGKTYPTPDVSLYQYDETSGYYYDPSTGLYYDAHSQYYYNNETGAYLYWDQRKSSYVLATPAAAAASVQDAVKQDATSDEAKPSATAEEEPKKEKKSEGGNKHDKVKVAKKIVKDMEKWAKQLNQKKDYTVVATPQPILPSKGEEGIGARPQPNTATGYADVGFSILEKKERAKLVDYMPGAGMASNKLVPAYASDSDDEHASGPSSSAAARGAAAATNAADIGEKDYVDFQKLTCLLCKRAFQSLDILQKHLKMSNLHKENLQKFNLARSNHDEDALNLALSYRDRAKERRLKYGESDPPPPNRSRERFESEIKSLTSRKTEAPAMPIGSNNVGNRLLQKMGWSEGQGLGRKNQGRTNIIEADARSSTAGLGAKATGIAHGDDYKTYIKKMMKARYESV